MIYGSNRIKGMYYYKTILEQIEKAGLELFEIGGVEANPRSYSVNQAADICKKENIDVLLTIGGVLLLTV